MKFTIIRWAFWFWFTTSGYYLWSKFWRFFLERKYRQVQLTPHFSISQLETTLGQMKWVSDPLGGLFDVISSPQKVEAHLKGVTQGKAEVGDCDDFAQYAAVAIQSMMVRGKLSKSPVYVMTVNWLDGYNKFHGHSVCCYKRNEGYYHIGNWHGGQAQGPYPSVAGVAMAIKGGGRLIGYALATSELKKVEVVV